MNTRVSSLIAKLLKEKGFDGYKDKYHYPNLSDKQEICLPTDWNKFTDMAGNSEYYSAPTIADVVMWLYEKYGIWVSVDMIYETSQIGFWYCIRQSKEDDKAIDSNEYPTPTEAYEAAFEHILNKLI